MRPSGWVHSVSGDNLSFPCAGGYLHHDFREANRIFLFFHKRAEPVFDVQDGASMPSGKFLAHDGKRVRAVFSTVEVRRERVIFCPRARFPRLPIRPMPLLAENAAN